MGKNDKNKYEDDEFSDWEMDEDFEEISLDDDENIPAKHTKKYEEEEDYYISDNTGEIIWDEETDDREAEEDWSEGEYITDEEEPEDSAETYETEETGHQETVYTFISQDRDPADYVTGVHDPAEIEQVPDATTQLPVIPFDTKYVGYDQTTAAVHTSYGAAQGNGTEDIPMDVYADDTYEEDPEAPSQGEYTSSYEDSYENSGDSENYEDSESEDAYRDSEDSYVDSEGSYEQEDSFEEEDDGEDDFDESGYYDYESEQEEEKDVLGSVMSKAVAFGGVAVVVLGCVVGGMIYAQSKNATKAVDTSGVGKQLKEVSLIGEAGLDAITNSYAGLGQVMVPGTQEEVPPLPEETPGYTEGDIRKSIKVSLSFTSIEKDLKIKFVNEDNGKLIGNVPFTVTVEGPDGKKDTWQDDDMDGIIYKKGITGGKYKVAINTLEDEKYKDYGYSTESFSTDVKKQIEYKKVDVRGEIKKESQIDPSKEDTKKNPTPIEKYLNDTVPWLESAVIEGGYQEITNDQIRIPVAVTGVEACYQQLAAACDYSDKKYTVMSLNGLDMGVFTEPAPTEEPTPEPTQEPMPEPTPEPTQEPTPEPTPEPTQEPTPVPTEEPVPSPTVPVTPTPTIPVTSSPEPTHTPGPSATPTPTIPVTSSPAPTHTPGPSASPTIPVTPTPSVTPTPTYSMRCNPSSLSLAVGESSTISAVPENMTLVNVFWASSDASSVTVDRNGKVTALKETTSPVTITVFGDGKTSNGSIVGSFSATCSVTVTKSQNPTPVITLGASSTEVLIGTPAVISVAVANAGANGTLSAESNNTAVALAEISSGSLKITGVSQGTATITVRYISGNYNVTATCTATVVGTAANDPRNDRTTPLKDKNGNDLFVLENNEYRQAHSADYYTHNKFYVKAPARYQGWQTINSRLRYYDASGNPVTGKQVIQGVEYDFGTDGYVRTGEAVRGIDVSKWNGEIDWAAVKNSGVSYVIIRCGYRGSSQGLLIEDPKFRANIQGASAAGLRVGVYFFTQAVDRVEAVEEASMVLDMVRDYNITYPIFLDVEPSGGRADGISKQTRTEVCTAFCATIQSAGYTAGVYANTNWFTEKIDASALGSYKIWLAQYASKPTYTGRYDIWQYKKNGRVAGMTGDVDLNLSYMGY